MVEAKSGTQPLSRENGSVLRGLIDDLGASHRYEQEEFPTVVVDERDVLKLQVDGLSFQLDSPRNGTTEHGSALDQLGHAIQKTPRPPDCARVESRALELGQCSQAMATYRLFGRLSGSDLLFSRAYWKTTTNAGGTNLWSLLPQRRAVTACPLRVRHLRIGPTVLREALPVRLARTALHTSCSPRLADYHARSSARP